MSDYLSNLVKRSTAEGTEIRPAPWKWMAAADNGSLHPVEVPVLDQTTRSTQAPIASEPRQRAPVERELANTPKNEDPSVSVKSLPLQEIKPVSQPTPPQVHSQTSTDSQSAHAATAVDSRHEREAGVHKHSNAPDAAPSSTTDSSVEATDAGNTESTLLNELPPEFARANFVPHQEQPIVDVEDPSKALSAIVPSSRIAETGEDSAHESGTISEEICRAEESTNRAAAEESPPPELTIVEALSVLRRESTEANPRLSSQANFPQNAVQPAAPPKPAAVERRSEDSAAEPETIVHVTIGRVEIGTTPQQKSRPAPRNPDSGSNLESYLQHAPRGSQ